MSEEYWLKCARELPPWGETKVECCKSDNSMKVYNKPAGWSAYCFRCGEHRFKAKGSMSISDIAKYKLAQEVIDTNEASFPTDSSSVFPDIALLWLFRYGITHSEIKDNGILYSPSLGRVILPVYDILDESKLVSLQMRAVYAQTPKYLNLGRSLPWVFTPANTKYTPNSNSIVITEDILSAIKVNRVCSAVSSLGTNFNPAKLFNVQRVFGDYFPVIWYDNDAAGRSGTKEAVKMFNLLGIEHRVVRTDKDPKCYTKEEIKEILCST